MKKGNKKQILKLKGKTAVFIDWANVYGWKSNLTDASGCRKLFKYLKNYSQIGSINFYYGEDNNQKSKDFLKEIHKIGFKLTSKPVKYIVVGKVNGTIIKKRKCDFDIEICMSVYECLENNFNSFVFFSGDGDFEPIYQFLISKQKQVIVIYEQGHLGKEIWNIKKGLFKTRLSYLKIK